MQLKNKIRYETIYYTFLFFTVVLYPILLQG
ncbi:hypothetical protein BACCAC_02721 [Bacteroides caccae ATCC 43185]|nr:hypothetical protein BACCAC_02721 [Bacteroides caccae ATCC 43185]